MKKTVKTLMTATMFAVAMGTFPTGTAETASADYNPYGEAIGTVYGPPVVMTETTTAQPVYGTVPYWTTMTTTNYNPQETFQTVYGPPVSQITTSVEDYNPKHTETDFAAVYGPAPYWTTAPTTNYDPHETTTMQTVYGTYPFWSTETTAISQETVPVPVYGPPLAWKGDLDGDNRIDVFDMIGMRRKYLEAVLYGEYDSRADVNDDGEVNVADMVMLQKYILGAAKDFSSQPDETTVVPNSNTTKTTVVEENKKEN